jgi:hypothetical protein
MTTINLIELVPQNNAVTFLITQEKTSLYDNYVVVDTTNNTYENFDTPTFENGKATLILKGLTNGTEYQFIVSAYDDIEGNPYTCQTVTPVAPPDEAKIVCVKRINGKMQIIMSTPTPVAFNSIEVIEKNGDEVVSDTTVSVTKISGTNDFTVS